MVAEDSMPVDLSIHHESSITEYFDGHGKAVAAFKVEGLGFAPQIKNIVSCVNLDCALDLNKVASLAQNVEYKSNRSAAVIIRIRQPLTTGLIFSTGKLICTGAKSEADSHIAARRYARMVQKMGYPVKFLDFRVQNIMATYEVNFPIRLEDLVHAQGQFSSYKPELFAGLIYRMVKPRIVLQIFDSGKIVFTGGKSQQQLNEAYQNIFPILQKFRGY